MKSPAEKTRYAFIVPDCQARMQAARGPLPRPRARGKVPRNAPSAAMVTRSVSKGTRFPRFRRLKRLLPRGSKLKWLFAAALVGPFLMLGLLWGFGLLLGTSIRIDVGLILLSIAAIIVALALYQAVQYASYASEAWVVLDGASLQSAAEHVDEFETRGIGLMGLTARGHSEILATPSQRAPRNSGRFWQANAEIARRLFQERPVVPS